MRIQEMLPEDCWGIAVALAEELGMEERKGEEEDEQEEERRVVQCAVTLLPQMGLLLGLAPL